jgi:hypothetical protein
MTFGISAGVYPVEIDLTVRPSPFPTSIGSIVFASHRGPLTPTFVSDPVRFTNLYGNPDASLSFGHYHALYFLQQSSMLWALRVVGPGATWACATYCNNWLSAGVYDGTSKLQMVGSTQEFDLDNREFIDIVFGGDLITGNQITLSVNGNAIPTVNFTTSNNNTLQLLAQAIQNVMDSDVASGGQAAPVSRVNQAFVANNRIVRIVSPFDQTITLTSLNVTGGASHPSITTHATEWLFTEYAENPGVWANGVATSISNIDTGTAQIATLSFSQALVTGNVFDGYINNVEIGPVNFTTDNNGTLTAIASAIQTALPGSTASVLAITGSEQDRQVQITAPNSSTVISLTALGVTGGASQPIVSWQTILDSIPPTYQFDYNVYFGSLVAPVWSETVALYDSTDGFGNQLNIAHNTNVGPTVCPFIRTVINPILAANLLEPLNSTTVSNTGNTGFLTGGEDGVSVSSQEVIEGWDQFSDPEVVTIRLMINAGYSTPQVQQTMVNIAEARKDCFAILDMPSDSQAAQDAVTYRNTQTNIDSSYGAIYSPDIYVYDQYNGQMLYIPPSGLVATQYAYNDKVAKSWFSPAGLNRGLVQAALGVRQIYNEGDRDLLSQAQINPIYKHGQVDYTIWGETTLQVATSDLSSVAVRRLLIYIETSLTDALAYSIFEPNDAFTQYTVTQLCNNFLLPVEQARGLYDFRVVCNSQNNPPQVVDARELYVDVYLKPVLSILYLQLRAILTTTGANFDEIIQQANGGAGLAGGNN